MAGRVLCVGYGVADTTAVMVDGDGRWVPLRFDGNDRLSSAVFLNVDGSLTAGGVAWQVGLGAPERFEAVPLRWLSAGQAVLGGVQVPVWDMVAATLRVVATQCRAMLGGSPVDQVRLVVPAVWGPSRRTSMRQAAWLAGLGQPDLVVGPAAIATHAAEAADGVPVRVGSFVAVCDLDGGVEACVLRRGPYGFEVLSVVEAPDAGGLAWDAVLAEQLTPASDPATAPGGPAESLVQWVGVWAAARAARDAIHTTPAVTVVAPTGPTVLPATVVYGAAAPLFDRAGRALAQAVKAAEIQPETLTAVWCAGPLAQAPPVVAAVAAASGLDARAAPQPRWAGLLGAAHVTGPAADATEDAGPPMPPTRRAAAALLPALASLTLLTHFLTSAHREQPAGISVAGAGILLADWGELALAALFGLLAALGLTTVFAAVLPTTDPFDLRPAGRPDGSWWDSQQIGPALAAAVAAGTAVAGLYAILASVILDWTANPFLRWALLPLVPTGVLVLSAAVLATRGRRIPAVGWHGWLGFPVWSVFAATVGMAAVQAAVTTSVYPSHAAALALFGRAGGALLGVAAALAVAQRAAWRLILAVPAGVLFAAITGWSTTGILACLYVAAVSLWWARRVWLLANRPHTALPYPR